MLNMGSPKKSLNVESPSFTPTFTPQSGNAQPAKMGISPKAATAAAFTPRGSGTSLLQRSTCIGRGVAHAEQDLRRLPGLHIRKSRQANSSRNKRSHLRSNSASSSRDRASFHNRYATHLRFAILTRILKARRLNHKHRCRLSSVHIQTPFLPKRL